MAESEVARLMQQITAEYQAAKRGLSGPALGTSQHAFITARMKNMQWYHKQLCNLIGDEQEAIKLVVQAIEQC